MESQNKTQPHKSKYVTYINGPLLFTAPHSGKLKRGGVEYGEKRRTHLRERYTSVLAMRFGLETANLLKHPVTQKTGTLGSFCFWSKDHKLNEVDIDPNYLKLTNLYESPFHQTLHRFQQSNQGLPLLHVDIHGKMDRKDSYELDLGVACMLRHWGQYNEDDFVINFIRLLTAGFNKVLKNSPKHKDFTATCNNDPYLNGDWGGSDIATMTEQAIILGIPSIQLEIPLKMRAQLFKDEKFSKEFLGVIIDTYQQLVVNWWPAKTVPLLCDPEISQLVEVRNFKKTDIEQMHQQYIEWEKKTVGTDKFI